MWGKDSAEKIKQTTNRLSEHTTKTLAETSKKVLGGGLGGGIPAVGQGLMGTAYISTKSSTYWIDIVNILGH
jgi:hypothetical protein